MKTSTFKPSDELTFDTVIANHHKLYQAIVSNQSGQFCLDLSQVSHCDSAGLALLIDAKKLCQQHQQDFSLFGLADKTRSLAEFCGVDDLLS